MPLSRDGSLGDHTPFSRDTRTPNTNRLSRCLDLPRDLTYQRSVLDLIQSELSSEHASCGAPGRSKYTHQ
ncbi:hypothetical protein BDV93DRAFT_527489 [Ceratobasidium sp. AG-I]|nr:hypothetical protein BDV93DRAFT_527489 [Ceratobasidium sp. AG-I]